MDVHYDFRLEYTGFEGVISAGQYGAGPVPIWDAGTYQHLPERDGEDAAAAIERGHLAFWQEGRSSPAGTH